MNLNTKLAARVCCASVAAIIAGLLWTACEVDPVATQVKVEPSSATVSQGQSVTFTASGGYDYTWSLSHPEWGTLSTTSGDVTTYTSTYSPGTGTSAVQVLTLNSSVAGSANSSNAAPEEWSTEVYITHI